jgi:hypothetical protein
MENPNLIERLENLIAALDEAHNASLNGDPPHEAERRIDDASGIAGEILTMVDGR